VKGLNAITVKGEKAVLVGINNDRLRIFTSRKIASSGKKLALND
jgi:hypothetical protein